MEVSRGSHMIRTGICSVTLRQLSVTEVVAAASAADLSCIEWGSDIHVPPSDVHAADLARDLTMENGLTVASYGSYFRAGWDDPSTFRPVVESAIRLGAPRIRVWAGRAGSREATAEQWRAVVDGARRAADSAAEAGIGLAFEFHGGTLTDDADSTVRLLEDVDRPTVRTYWQPPVGLEDGPALAGLRRVLRWVSAVHVFSWWPGQERQLLGARAELWRSVFDLLSSTRRNIDALLEFVPGDDPGVVRTEACTLTGLVGAPVQ
jgi:3-dehydroshikimate dehydratase